jgi:hypothetical protein
VRFVPSWRQIPLQLYRLAVLAAIVVLMHTHALRLRLEGDTPLTISEIAGLYPKAAALLPEEGERRGFHVLDAAGQKLGYVLRTMPEAGAVMGYRGWTDTLVAFDPALHVIGVRVRESQDTREHVQDVRDDRYYLKTWNGKSWDEVAGKTPQAEGIEGVSGATMTSMAMAEGIMRRLAASNKALATPLPPVRRSWRDAGLLLVIVAGLVLSFTGTYGRRWLRRGFQVAVIAYVGFITGDLLAQSLMAGWAQGGAPWRSAPGLVLLLAAALAVPWATGKPLYCQQLCPHGAAQELLHSFAPRRWRIALPPGLAAGLRWLPPMLLGLVVIVSMLTLPFELSHLEPFDAYVPAAVGAVTLAIALAGLVASLFVPMAYCHYGCPTGALLNFIRSHGRADRFGRGDLAALLLLVLAAGLSWKYHAIHSWIVAV